MVYLEINDDSSQKFWKIEQDASKKMIVTNWGKIGGCVCVYYSGWRK